MANMSRGELPTIIDLQPVNKQLLLQFSDLSFKAMQNGKEIQILNNVCGRFETGNLSALLGPSGAGKTTLLNILSGFVYKNVNGKILLNGENRIIKDFNKISSYIAQDFAMLDFLTVMETMSFASDLKLNRNISKENKLIRIKNIIKILKLDKCGNSLVSQLSGGERKRLSIGVELISNPPIMFFDEPTSGLDSVSSLQILSYLRQLAQNGRMIICVVHQPSSQLIKLFDDVLILAEGHSIYNGKLEDLLNSFQKVGLKCPNYYNVADFVLEVASKEHGSECLSTLSNNNENKYFLSDENNVDEEKRSLLQNENYVSEYSNHNINFNEENLMKKFCREFLSLTCRSLRSTWRDLMCVQLRVLCHILVGVLIGVVFWDIGNDASKILSNSSCLFFFVIFIFFANSMPSVLSCPLETSVFLREHLNGWYSIESYFLSKIFSDLPLQVICPTVFACAAYFLTGQPIEFDRFTKVWTIALLTAVLGHSLGLVSGSAFNIKLAVFLVPASCIPMLIFSGFFIRAHELSAVLRPLTSISYFRYSLEGFTLAIYGNNRTNLICPVPFCYYKTPEKFLHDMDMDKDFFINDVIALLIWIIIFQILLYISLIIKVKKAH